MNLALLANEIARRVPEMARDSATNNAEAIQLMVAAEVEQLVSERVRYRAALDRIAAWTEGPEVTGHFDEPHAAWVAREALKP